ncbi:MAG: hypothetical protein ACI9OJ_003538, partial [Myxococcota bacterium]
MLSNRFEQSNGLLSHGALRVLTLALFLTGASCSSDTETGDPADTALPDFDFGTVTPEDTGEGTDGSDDTVNPFFDDVDDVSLDVCSASCGGKTCGGDGCGGSCGECELGFACEPGGTCQPNGDTCAGALEVGALPFTLQGNGAGLTD